MVSSGDRWPTISWFIGPLSPTYSRFLRTGRNQIRKRQQQALFALEQRSMNRPSNNKRQAMKTELSIQTPSAGIVRVVPDYLEVKGCVGLQYLSEVTTAQRTAAAHYLFDEGFIEFRRGKDRTGATLIDCSSSSQLKMLKIGSTSRSEASLITHSHLYLYSDRA